MEKERKALLLWEAASQERKTEDDRQRNGEREGGRKGKSSDGAGERERETHGFSKRAKIKLHKKTARDEKGGNRNRSKIEDRRRDQHISATYPSVQRSS